MPANHRREARRKAGFRTQADLADKLGLVVESVNRFENGRREAPKWYDDYIRLLGKENHREPWDKE